MNSLLPFWCYFLFSHSLPRPILKVSIEFVTILLLFFCFRLFFGRTAYGILAPQAGTIEPALLALEGKV